MVAYNITKNREKKIWKIWFDIDSKSKLRNTVPHSSFYLRISVFSSKKLSHIQLSFRNYLFLRDVVEVDFKVINCQKILAEAKSYTESGFNTQGRIQKKLVDL